MIAAFALALMAAQPGIAAGDARCVLDSLTPADRGELSQAAQQNRDPPEPVQARVNEIVVGCAEQLSWTPDRAASGVALALALVIRDDVGRRLSSNGVDAGQIETWFGRQDDGVRTSPNISSADAERAILELHQAGTPLPALEANAELIGAWLGARILIERVERGLPIQ